MRVGLLRKIDKKTGEHKRYKHIIFYKVKEDRRLDIKLSIPAFFLNK